MRENEIETYKQRRKTRASREDIHSYGTHFFLFVPVIGVPQPAPYERGFDYEHIVFGD